MTRTYFSEEPASGAGPVDVFVRCPAAGRRKLDPRLDLARHSPSGFSWGYRGSGPAQLALAVTADALGDERALAAYQDFKDDVVAPRDEDAAFLSTSAAVEAWAAAEKY